jgi:hypothetical protein
MLCIVSELANRPIVIMVQYSTGLLLQLGLSATTAALYTALIMQLPMVHLTRSSTTPTLIIRVQIFVTLFASTVIARHFGTGASTCAPIIRLFIQAWVYGVQCR